MFHPSLVWVDATTAAPAPQVGWSYADGVFSAPDGPTLAQVQTAQIAIIEAAYQVAIQQPVSYMSTTFQADLESQDVLARSLVPGAVPSGFFWLDANNSQVPMTFAQLQGLAGAMLAQGQAAFSKKTGLKQQIRAATSIFAAQSIVWS
ncbi:DUF4376 domain-containing protein [Cupriavidus metallidurans]|uniref:DUF4376 domain-containing protein n=2 Tax=Burkholderiaceae TaxID=119060 RepID=A0A482IRD8_9BURK|nr:DUF4376 domain-containing protein [Cupriavidus metallidurans]HBD37523.1 hypothetical protein [Cupriavidus sp.]HBO79553.1 hypothetical protein [Cupriavidus sp.]